MNEQTVAPVALITGASLRLGAGIARQLHKQGYNLILHYRHSVKDAQALADELQATRRDSVMMVSAFLDQRESLAALIEHVLDSEGAFHGRLDVLINNASAFYPTPVTETTPEQWNELLNTNLRAPFLLAQGLFPALKKHNGCIINITDIYGDRPLANHAVYSMTKAGLISLTKSLALEFAPEIRTNAISPGAILWPEREANDTAYHEKILAQVPLERLGKIENIAETVSFIIANDYINGQVIAIDGGKSLT